MNIEKKIKTITKKVEIYQVDDKEFESCKEAEEYIISDFYDNKLERHIDEIFNVELFKCNSKDEFDMVRAYFREIHSYVFDVKFDIAKSNYPLYCLYMNDGEVYNISKKLYEGLIEFEKEK